MTLLWHLAKKDLWYLRWPFGAWVILTVMEALLRAVGPLFVDATRIDSWYTLNSVTNFLPITRGLLYVLIIALLVLKDPLVGTNAFWLTRPIPRRTLFWSKLLAGALVLTVPSLVAQIALMLGFRVPLLDIAGILPDLLIGAIAMLVVAVFAASLAGSLTQFVIGITGVVVFVWMAFAVLVMVVTMSMRDFEPTPPRYLDPTAGVVMLMVFVIAMGGVTRYHYATRRPGRSLLLALGTVGFVVVIGSFWPSDLSFYGGQPQLPTAMQDPKVTSLRLTRPIRHVFDERSTFMDNPPQRRIAAPLVLDGVPDGYMAEPFTLRPSVRMPSGTVVRGTRAQPVIVDVETGHARPGTSLSLSVAGRPRSRKPGTVIESWPVVFRAPVDVMRQAEHEAGEYSGRLLYTFTRFDPLTTTAVPRDLTFFDGPRGFRVWVLGERGDACIVLVRRTMLQPRSWAITRPTLSETFRDRETRRPFSVHQSRGMYDNVSFGGWSAEAGWSQWFQIVYQVFDVLPEEMIWGAPTTGRGVSCDSLELVLRRQSYAGRLERALTLPAFRLNAQPGDLTGDESQVP